MRAMFYTTCLMFIGACVVLAQSAFALPPSLTSQTFMKDTFGELSDTLEPADRWCDTKNVPTVSTSTFTSPISATYAIMYEVQPISVTTGLMVALNPSDTAPPTPPVTNGSGWGNRLRAAIGASTTQVVTNTVAVHNTTAAGGTVTVCWRKISQ